MADPRSVVPYHDPYDNPLDYECLNFMSGQPNPTLSSLPSSSAAMDTQPNLVQSTNNATDPDDLFDDPMLWDIFVHYPNQGNSQEAGPSQVNDGGNGNGGGSGDNPNPGFPGGGRPISLCPPPPVPFGCTFCQVLRELIHTDGNCSTKLEIHGRLGLICHAILQTWDHVKAGPTDSQNYMFDFCKKSIEEVKVFLLQYCADRKNAGFVMVQDPLQFFYEALMVGLDSDENDDFFDGSPTNSGGGGDHPVNMTDEANEAEKMPRSNLALQRERAGKLTLKDLEGYFHLPIEEASRRMNLCPTVVKKICRRDGMLRWPHRKIKAIQKQITNLSALLNSNDPAERAIAEAEIQRLEGEISKLCTTTR